MDCALQDYDAAGKLCDALGARFVADIEIEGEFVKKQQCKKATRV